MARQRVSVARLGSAGWLFAGILLFFATSPAQVDTAWVRRWSGLGSLTDLIAAVTTDRWGNVIAVGYTLSDNTSQDLLVLKYAPDGTLSWFRRYDAEGLADVAQAVVCDTAGNIYLTGYSYRSSSGADYLTRSYDPDGNLRWSDRYDGPGNASDFAQAIALDSSGNVYVTGYSTGSNTYEDFCTIKYNANGSRLWVARYAGASNERALAIATDLSGNVYVTGYTQAGNDYLTVKYNTNGAQQWFDRYNGDGNGNDQAVAVCTDRWGNCYVTGASTGLAGADLDYVTIKYSPTGNREWIGRYNGEGNDNDYGYRVIADRDGNVYVTGYTSGLGTLFDVTTIKYSSLGQRLWVRSYDGGGNAADYGRAIALDHEGNVYVGGMFARENNYDFLTLSYTAGGDQRWLATYDGPGNWIDYLNGMAVDRWGNVVVGGVSYSGSATGYDCALIKYIQPDVAALRVLYPTGTVDTSTVIVPQAVVANRGTAPTDLRAFLMISRPGGQLIYRDSVVVSGLGTGETTLVSFAEWPKPHLLGAYEVRCSTYRAQDRNPANNVVRAQFQITAGPYGWMEVSALPSGPSGRQVKDGGALTFSVAENRIYAIKGNRSGDFYFYQPNLGSWVTLPVIPTGPSGKLPGKGARLACDNQGNVYLVRGNNTREFWRFSADSGWVQLEDIPAGASGKGVKGGSDLIFVEADECLYLLKGYRNEFYRFRVASGSWEELAPAPPGERAKWDNGSFIVYDGDWSIYACRAKHNELWRYDVGAGVWDTLNRLRGLPFVGRSGRSTKLKDGGCGAYFDGSIFALKGAGTGEFWRYDIAGDSWVELDTMPSLGSSGKRKRVKSGADIVYGGDAFYAFKGNKTLEFWRYALGPGGLPGGGMSAGMVQPAGVLRLSAGLVAQNRFRIELPGAGDVPVRVTVYDAAGRRVGQSRSRLAGGRMELELEGTGTGVYYLVVEGAGLAGRGKVVVRR